MYAGEPNSRAVRVVFHKTADSWQAYPTACDNQTCLDASASQYPAQVSWTVALDGRNLGRLTSRKQDFRFYSHVGLQEIVGGPPVPTVGNRSSSYSGNRETAVSRPLVAVARPFFKDPDGWRPTRLAPDFVSFLQQQFRKKFPKLCRADKKDETKLQGFPFRDDDVKVIKAYMSRERDGQLPVLHLDGAIDCADREAGLELDDPWFVTDPHKTIRYIGAGMWLVDSGDYDNDGHSELLFSIDRENRGGYELFYDGFEKHAIFEFGYH